MASEINRENSIAVLVNSVNVGQKMGAYQLREAKLLHKAVQYFNPEVKTKPDFEGSANPEITAINLLLQGVQKAQLHGGDMAFSLDDAALISDVVDWLLKEYGKQVGQNVNTNDDKSGKKGSKNTNESSVKVSRHEDEDDEDDEDLPTITPRKGKGRAADL